MRHATRRTAWATPLGLLVVLLGLIGGLAARPAAAQDNGLASITIYTTSCPADYAGSNLYRDCYNNPQRGIHYLFGPSGGTATKEATTGANGFAAIEGIASDGTYVLQADLPGEFVRSRVLCSKNGASFPISASGPNAITLSLTVHDDLRCDWYLLPESGRGDPTPTPAPTTGSLTIYKTTCPSGYTGTNYYRDCFGHPVGDVTFFVFPQGSDNGVALHTDANGLAGIDLPADTYVLAEDIPGKFNRWVVYCTQNGGQSVSFGVSADKTRAIVDVAAGAKVRCDWYNIPENLSGRTPTAQPQPQPTATRPAGGVIQLPNTGAGPADSLLGAWLVLALAALLALVIAAGARLLGARR